MSEIEHETYKDNFFLENNNECSSVKHRSKIKFNSLKNPSLKNIEQQIKFSLDKNIGKDRLNQLHREF